LAKTLNDQEILTYLEKKNFVSQKAELLSRLVDISALIKK